MRTDRRRGRPDGLRVLLPILLTAATLAPAQAWAQSPALEASPAGEPIRIVVIGDSIGDGRFCPTCTGWVDRYAAAVEARTGRPVELKNRSRNDSATLPMIRDQVVGEPLARTQVTDADIVIVSAGYNSVLPDPTVDFGCTDPDWGATDADFVRWSLTKATPECIQAGLEAYAADYDTVFGDIVALRVGRPTVFAAINVHDGNKAHPVLANVGLSQDELDRWEAYLTDIYDRWNAMLCDRAEAAGFLCIDVYHVFNGPTGEASSAPWTIDNAHPNDAGSEAIAGLLAELDVSAIAGAGDASPPPRGPSPAATVDERAAWAADLAAIDAQVRARHPDPFAINPESAWVAKLAELQGKLPGASPDEQTVQLASLVGLLDSHSALIGPIHLYPVWAYRFPEGWFVVKAGDASLVGSRLLTIDGTPVDAIEAALRPLVAADNESGELIGLQDQLATMEILHGLGIVSDPTSATFVLQSPDGSQRTERIAPERGQEFGSGLTGYLMGDATEAVARRSSPLWGRLDTDTKTYVLSYNDYTVNRLARELASLTAALDDGSATRVVLDMRYLRGGNGGLAEPLIAALRDDPRINREGGLTVLIGRENASAATMVAGILDRDTHALMVGEPTPARADNFLCECVDIELQESEFVVSIPTVHLRNGDAREAVIPDIAVELSAADFFAGRDLALDLAITGGQIAGGQIAGEEVSTASSLPVIDDADARILHTHLTGAGGGIFLMRPDGTDVIQLATDVAGSHKHPDWSPDGRHVVFVDDDATGRIWIAHLDGAPTTLLAECAAPGCDYPAWSPDGTRIVYTAYEPPLTEGPPAASSLVIHELATDETTTVIRLDDLLLADVARWSPDGTQLVFGVDLNDAQGCEVGSAIAIVPADGGEPRYLTNFDQWAYYPDWNRATGQIVFSTEVIGYQCSPGPEAETWDLHLIETDGTGGRQLTHVEPGQRLWNPSWTPDGTRITAGFEDTRLGVWVDPTTGAIEPFPTAQLMSRPRLRPVPAT